MSRYASGKHAFGICDRSGERVPYKDLVTEEWSGLRVARHWLEPDPRRLKRQPHDAQALRNPRPEPAEDLTYLVDIDGVYVETEGAFKYNPFIEVT